MQVRDDPPEEWRPAPGDEGVYSISSLGRVRREAPGPRTWPGRVLRHNFRRRHRYPTCRLTQGGKGETIAVHELVIRAFHGAPPSPNHETRHRDGNRLNPRADNLQWGTRLENVGDARRHGTLTRGERQGHAKLTEGEVLEIVRMLSGGSGDTELGRRFGVSASAIREIRVGRNWRWLTGIKAQENANPCPATQIT